MLLCTFRLNFHCLSLCVFTLVTYNPNHILESPKYCNAEILT